MEAEDGRRAFLVVPIGLIWYNGCTCSGFFLRKLCAVFNVIDNQVLKKQPLQTRHSTPNGVSENNPDKGNLINYQEELEKGCLNFSKITRKHA